MLTSRRGRHPQGEDNEGRGQCAEDGKIDPLGAHGKHAGPIWRQDKPEDEGQHEAGGKQERADSETIKGHHRK